MRFRNSRSGEDRIRFILPVAGKITEKNTALNDAPEAVNTDPYGTDLDD